MIAAAVALCFLIADPPLPAHGGTVALSAQEWEFAPGPRTIDVYVYYPRGDRNNVTSSTGLMLCLHNWGGTRADGAPDPVQVSDRYDVVAICVDYVQSGTWDATKGVPYDFGFMQALDALRALHYVFQSLDDAATPFARGRIYAAGGSGGGNVALMANKLAPRTFACVVDISGMTTLNDGFAFGLPGGQSPNAGYSRDEHSASYLSDDARAIRSVGHPDHLKTMRALGNEAMAVVVHGADDPVCPPADARETVAEFERAGLGVVPHFIGAADLDGDALTDTKHSLGDRTKILFKFGDEFMRPGSPHLRVRPGKTDFERSDAAVRYTTPHGAYVISCEAGCPVGMFVPAPAGAASSE